MGTEANRTKKEGRGRSNPKDKITIRACDKGGTGKVSDSDEKETSTGLQSQENSGGTLSN